MKTRILAALALAISGCAVYARPAAPVAYVIPAPAYVMQYPAGYYGGPRVVIAAAPVYRPVVYERRPGYGARVVARPAVREARVRR